MPTVKKYGNLNILEPSGPVIDLDRDCFALGSLIYQRTIRSTQLSFYYKNSICFLQFATCYQAKIAQYVYIPFFYVCMYVCTYACTCVCMCVCMYVCMYECMYVLRMCVCVYVCMYVFMHVCMYVCMYVLTYVCICIYLYVCIYIYRERESEREGGGS